MDKATIARSAEKLADRVGGAGPRVVGVLTMDENGSVAVTVDADIEVDVIELGIRARARRANSVISRDLSAVSEITGTEADR